MPTIDGPGRTEMLDLLDLLDACERLADLQHRLAGDLHTLGLLDDTTRLNTIAQADQIDACIEQARHPLITGGSGSDIASSPGPRRHDSRRDPPDSRPHPYSGLAA
ncbi:hypothetical protein [Actinoplanes derwentensis]|uniref:Uncharacterized protein n=1 Tax=Actinoplanes derwentensis TaxID=113562 RepID=A0A1H1WLB5_9ACTN|nr:hypothetical protein [Actinoplanes derwentensis]GID87062.1 hypothetical protein Ade03nite_59860 [Actinoplanes derwentensis]SDS97885.1 hypothetical protein SAMN04489716_2151 [Actinoplanes derwentensis]